MQKNNRIGAMIAASFFMWLSTVLVDIIARSTLLTGLAVFAAFCSTLALWLEWGMNLIRTQDTQEEKTKRESGDDSRLALLLTILDKKDRQTIKDRLLDELSADGELLSLAALIEEQDDP